MDGAELAARMVSALANRSIDEARQLCDERVELTTLFDEPGRPGFRGHPGLQAWFERLDRTWAFIEIGEYEVEERDAWVIASGRARVRGRASPNELEIDFTAAGRIEAGRFSKLGLYLSREDALRAIEAE